MIRLFHPSVAPHVQQAALALHEAGQLDQLMTGIINDPNDKVQHLIIQMGRLLGQDWSREFSRRSVTCIPRDKITTQPWGELLRAGFSRLDRDQRLSDLLWEQTEGHFDRHIAHSLHQDLTGVYGWEYSSRHTFKQAKALGLKVAYEMPAPEPVFVHELLESERAKFPELDSPYARHVARREQMWIDRRHQEWDCADVVIAASDFTRKSYAKAGWDTDNVQVVHLGAPDPVDVTVAQSGGNKPELPLRLIWAGTFNVRKGAHYVLDAWREYHLGQLARLDVYGSNALPPRLTETLPDGVHLHGSIPRRDLWQHFQQADALLFPTLCDGYGMVVTEAWSQGLPVITTDRAGVAERLKANQTGKIIEAASATAIAEAVEWCHQQREALIAMRLPSRNAAAEWTWSHYRSALRAALKDYFK